MKECIPKVNGFLGGRVGDDRQDRAKDLFVHQWRVEVDVAHNRRREIAVLEVDLSAIHYVATVLQQVTQSLHVNTDSQNSGYLKLSFADDARVAFAFLRVFAVRSLDVVFQSLHEVFLHVAVAKDVVARNTGLPAIPKLPPSQ